MIVNRLSARTISIGVPTIPSGEIRARRIAWPGSGPDGVVQITVVVPSSATPIAAELSTRSSLTRAGSGHAACAMVGERMTRATRSAAKHSATPTRERACGWSTALRCRECIARASRIGRSAHRFISGDGAQTLLSRHVGARH